jgi:hypothetical protein
MTPMIRQGDVLIVAVNEIPKDLSRKTSVLVAEGEATGHAHVLEPTEDGQILTDVDREFIRITGASGVLVHDEHTAIELPPGDYRVVRQREYAPEANRMVED